MIINQIKWSPNETLIEIGGFSIYIYSLMFILAFILGYNLVKSFFIKEKIDEKLDCGHSGQGHQLRDRD